MKAVEFTGIVREVIDTVNNAYFHGARRWPVVKRVEMTRAEMDEFIANNPFTGRIGKFYGDDTVGSLLHIESRFNPEKGEEEVLSFNLDGITFTVI